MEKLQNLRIVFKDPKTLKELDIYQYDSPIIIDYNIVNREGIVQTDFF